MSKSAVKTDRRVARALILQILYELDVTDHKLPETLAYHINEAELKRAQKRFVRQIIFGTVKYKSDIDQAIQEVATEWPLEQLPPVDRNILRMAFYELNHQMKRAHQIVIHEAVELARLYGSENSTRFINGVLGTLVKGQPSI